MTRRRAGRTAAACRDAARRNRPVLSRPPRRGDARSSRPRGGTGRRAEQLVHLGAQEPVVRVRGRGLADCREALSRRRPALPEPAHLRVERREPRRERLGLVRARPRLPSPSPNDESSPNQRSHAPGSAGPPATEGNPPDTNRSAQERQLEGSPATVPRRSPPRRCRPRSPAARGPRGGEFERAVLRELRAPERDDDVPRPGLPLRDPAARTSTGPSSRASAVRAPAPPRPPRRRAPPPAPRARARRTRTR